MANLVITYETNDGQPCSSDWLNSASVNHTYDSGIGIGSVELLNGSTNVGDEAFYTCRNLTSVNLPYGITSLGERTFLTCTNLTSINLPSSITRIGNNAFYGCSSLTSINLPSSITSISNYMFSQSGLTSIELPSSITSIGEYAFFGTDITELNIPDGVVSLGINVCTSCRDLVSVTIPDSVTSIGGNTFGQCTSLISVTLPSGLTSLPYSMFSSCTSLASVNIPETVTSLGNGAFSSCSALASIHIPENVNSIGDSAFSNCSALRSVNIPEAVNVIGRSVFSNCTLLDNVIIPSRVTSIGNDAFSSCISLHNIVIPESVTSIGVRAFRNCTSLASVTSYAVNPPTLGSQAFYGLRNSTLYVPYPSIQSYKSSDWRYWFTIYEPFIKNIYEAVDMNGNSINAFGSHDAFEMEGSVKYDDGTMRYYNGSFWKSFRSIDDVVWVRYTGNWDYAGNLSVNDAYYGSCIEINMTAYLLGLRRILDFINMGRKVVFVQYDSYISDNYDGFVNFSSNYYLEQNADEYIMHVAEYGSYNGLGFCRLIANSAHIPIS